MNWWVLQRKVHASWLIAICCMGIFTGVVVARYSVLWLSPLFYLAVAIICIIATFRWNRIYIIPLAILGGFTLGMARGTVAQTALNRFKPLYGQNVNVVGVVTDDVDIGTGDQVVIRLSTATINGREIVGNLWVVSGSAVIKRGDRLELNGKIAPGFGSFAGTIYKAKIRNIIHPQPADLALAIRDWFASKIRSVLSEPEASLGIGFLVGQRRALSADLVTALQTVGLTHIVVASGYNLTILVRIARRLFAKISKYLSAMTSLVMIGAFITITGASPSMTRAGFVSVLSLAAWYYGRQFHPLILLSLAIAATVLINPSYAWGDLGWQLSFAAFAGVMVLAPLVRHYFFGDTKLGLVPQVLTETISAQIITAPILVLTFGQISNIAIVANLMVLPLIPLAMLLTFVAGLAGAIAPGISHLLSLPASLLLKYMSSVINFFADLPWAVSKFQPSPLAVVGCYVLVLAICLYMWRVTKYNLRDVNLVE